MSAPDEPPIQPIIIEPEPLPRPGNPATNDYVLWDDQFPVETRARWAVKDPSRPLRRPHFSVPQVGYWVFAWGEDWTKEVLRPARGDLELPHIGTLTFRRLAKGRSHANGEGERRLTLPDIERLIHALMQSGELEPIVAQNAMNVVFAVARQWQNKHSKDGRT